MSLDNTLYEIKDGKVYRKLDNKVAVLYSPGYGNGWVNDQYGVHWSTDSDIDESEKMVFEPRLIDYILTEDETIEMPNYLKNKFKSLSAIKKLLTIRWVPAGSTFRIHEYL
jgi:hypothetical protein